MMANEVKLWCLLFLNYGPNNAFSITIRDDETISDLKEVIKSKNRHAGKYDAHELLLYKLNEPFPITPANNLSQRIKNKGDIESFAVLLEEPAYRIRDVFLDQAHDANLYIIAKLPPEDEDQPPTKRPRFGSPVSEQESKGAEARSNVIDFHRKIWNKRDANEDVFKVTAIVRGDPPSNVRIPDVCCVMTSPLCTSGSVHLSGIFIRNEYVQAVKDIDAFYKGRIFALNDDIPEESDDKTDTTMQVDDPNPEVDTGMNTSIDVAKSSADLVAFPTTIPNPFLDTDFPVKLMRTGVIITGTPGIGKSLLLEFILHLRSLAGLTTVFVRENDTADLFTSFTVTRFPRSHINTSMLPPSTWILVDSNQDLIDVPEWVVILNRFIVQAASPGAPRMKWRRKNVGVWQYFLKPWSVEEVLAARMLQKLASPSEAELETFCERYAPSARAAFNSTSTHSVYESCLDRKIQGLSVQQVITLMNDLLLVSISDDLPHQIFIIRPGRTRNIPLIEFATQYLTNKVVDTLGPKLTTAAQELFEVYRRNKLIKGAAGQLLGSVVSGIFTRGGSWKIRQMERSKTERGKFDHWKIQPSSTSKDEYLVVGLAGLADDLLISNTPPAKHATFEKIDVRDFPATGSVNLVTTYYLPVSRSEATFDSFFYDAELQQATVLQLSTSNSDSVKVRGLERLHDLGVRSVRYVAVTGPQSKFDLSVPIQYANFLKEKYHLVLEELD